jgi:hypothetical protein
VKEAGHKKQQQHQQQRRGLGQDKQMLLQAIQLCVTHASTALTRGAMARPLTVHI